MLPEVGHRRGKGLKFDGGVESGVQRFAAGGVETLDAAEIKLRAARGGLFAPHLDRASHVGKERRTINSEDRLAVDADIARIAEDLIEQVADVRAVVLFGVILPDQHLLFAAVPRPRPVFIGPAEHEGEVGFPRSEHLLQRPLHQLVTVEPVMVVAEPRQTVSLGQLRLPVAHFGHPQVVKS